VIALDLLEQWLHAGAGRTYSVHRCADDWCVEVARHAPGEIWPVLGTRSDADLETAARAAIAALDADGRPQRLSDVRSIEPVDLGPVEFREVETADGTLTFDPPIVIGPRLDDEEQQNFVADVPEFGLILSGRTRDELLQDWEEQVQFIWREYALAPEETLAPDAQDLRGRLLARATSGRRHDDT